MINEIVTQQYIELGYHVEPAKIQGKHSFEAVIRHASDDDSWVNVMITTKYPSGCGKDMSLRATCTINA